MTFDHRKFWKLHLKRNHKRLLQSSKRLVRSNRANGDVSLILMRKNQMYPDADELRQICGYVVDYATKCTETESDTRKSLKQLIMTEKENISDSLDMKRVATRCMNQLHRDKVIGKQEADCLMGGLDLYSCSETIETISISNMMSIDAHGNVTEKKDLTNYKNRKDAIELDMTFYDWLIYKKSNKNKGKSIVIPHFVGGDTRTTFPITEEYARHVLMCYKPWKGDFETIIGKTESCVTQYNQWLESDKCPKIVKIKHAQAQEAEEAKAKNDRMNEPLADNTIREIDPNDNDIDQDTRDACNLYNTMFYTPEKNELWDEQLDLGVNYDWSSGHLRYPNGMTMEEIEKFITEKSSFHCNEVVEEQTENDGLDIPLDNDGHPFSIENLQEDQQQAFFMS